MSDTRASIERAMATLGTREFLLTAAHDLRRAVQIVRFVQQCAIEPPLVCVASLKGHGIEPLIRDSRSFALCALDDGDRLLRKRLIGAQASDELGARLDAIEIGRLATGAPILAGDRLVLDCEVVRHIDLDADYELYIGQVVAAKVPDNGQA